MTPDRCARTHEGPHLRGNPGASYKERSDTKVVTIFFHEVVDLRQHFPPSEVSTLNLAEPGWYWEDSEEKPNGPFRTSALAYVDATRGNYP